jgi:hypothetical protein
MIVRSGKLPQSKRCFNSRMARNEWDWRVFLFDYLGFEYSPLSWITDGRDEAPVVDSSCCPT